MLLAEEDNRIADFAEQFKLPTPKPKPKARAKSTVQAPTPPADTDPVPSVTLEAVRPVTPPPSPESFGQSASADLQADDADWGAELAADLEDSFLADEEPGKDPEALVEDERYDSLFEDD